MAQQKSNLAFSNPDIESLALRKILLVSSDPKLSDLVKSQLELTGLFEVTPIASTAETFGAIEKQKFSLILVDEKIDSDSDGLSLSYQLQNSMGGRLEIIMFSHSPQKVSLHECHQIGISNVLKNPVNIDDLISCIDKLVPVGRLKYEQENLDFKNLSRYFGVVKTQKKPSRIFSLEVAHLGRGGFFYQISSNSPMPEVGQIVDFKISLSMVPNTVIQGTGIIRWFHSQSGRRGFGVEFLHLPVESEKLLMAFVELFKISAYVPDNHQADEN